MADKTISALTGASTPLAGTEVLPIVQSSTTKNVSVANLTAGRAVSAAGLTDTTLTQGSVLFAGPGGAHTQDNANFFWNDTNNRLGIGTASPGATLHTSGGSTTLASLFSSASTATYAATGNNAGRVQLSGVGGSNYTNGIQFSQGGSSELFFGQIQESGGAGRFVWQGYTGVAYRQFMSLSASTGQLNLAQPSAVTYSATGYNGAGANGFLAGVGGSGNLNGVEFSAGGSNENFFGVVQEAGGAGAFVFQGYDGSAYRERARINSSGNFVIGKAGSGIDFSANTNAPGMTSELLTWYETGTWTPSVGGDATYTARSGTYTRIGNFVTVSFDITINVLGTGSTNTISGLPFAVVTPGGASTIYFSNLAINSLYVSALGSGSTLVFTGQTTAQATMNSAIAILGNGARVQMTATYLA